MARISHVERWCHARSCMILKPILEASKVITFMNVRYRSIQVPFFPSPRCCLTWYVVCEFFLTSSYVLLTIKRNVWEQRHTIWWPLRTYVPRLCPMLHESRFTDYLAEKVVKFIDLVDFIKYWKAIIWKEDNFASGLAKFHNKRPTRARKGQKTNLARIHGRFSDMISTLGLRH